MQTAAETPKPRKVTITDVVEGAPAPAKSPAAAPVVPSKFVPSQLLDIELIEPDPENPRKDFPKEEMQQLTNSILLRGVEQAIEVRPIVGGRYRITFGERRWRAAKAAGLKQIPATIKPRTDLEAADVQLAENLDRADLSPLEIAGGYQRQLTLGRTMEQVCERAGKKRSAVYAMVQLLQLGPDGRKALGEEKISMSVAQLVARVPKALQDKALGIVLGTTWQGPLNFRQAEEQLGKVFTVDLRKAPWELKSEATPCVAKSCAVCPKRAGNAPDLYPDIKNPDTCTDRVSYDQKLHLEMKKSVEAKGYKLLPPDKAPPADIFYNGGRGHVQQESGFIDPADKCFDDTQNRPYKDLLAPEHFKTLAKVALDVDGKPRQLLERAGLMREVKKAGLIKLRKKNAAPAKSSSSSSSSSSAPKKAEPARYRDPPPNMDDLVDTAVWKKMVEAAEKKGLPAIATMVAFELACVSYKLAERRGIKDKRYLTGKDCQKYFGKYSPAELAGLLFDVGFDQRLENGDDMTEPRKALGVDEKKVRAEVEKTNPVRWSEDQHGATGEGLKGAEYVIEKKGKAFFFSKPKAVDPVLFATLELAKAAAAKVDTGAAPGFAFTATGMKPDAPAKKAAPKKAPSAASKKGGGK